MSGYTPYYSGGWQSGESGGTPITPAALNNMESGIGAALTAVDVVNNLTSTATDKPLSAAQGKALNDNALMKADLSIPKTNYKTWFRITKGTSVWHFVPLQGALNMTISIVSCTVGDSGITSCTLQQRMDGGIVVITTWTSGADEDWAELTMNISI